MARRVKVSTVVDKEDRDFLLRLAEQDYTDISTVLRRLIRETRIKSEPPKDYYKMTEKDKFDAAVKTLLGGHK